jgi:hypothetical protein
VALDRWHPSLDRRAVGKVPDTQAPTFVDYARAAFRRLALPDLTPEQIAELGTMERDYAPRRTQVVAFWSLRCLLGPLVETLLLLDRWQYLRENGHKAHLVPAFDPRLSPRNIIIVTLVEAAGQKG